MSKKFIKSSLILFIGSMTANAGAYFFHLALGRILSPEQYGILGALLSVYLIVSAPLQADQNTAAKIFCQFDSACKQVTDIINKSARILNIISVISFLVFFIISIFLLGYLNLNSYSGLLLLGLSLLAMFKLSWNRGVMQGLFNFNQLSFSYAAEGLTKLFFGILLGVIFLKADYTVFSITLSLLVAYILSIFYIKKITSVEEKNCHSIKLDTKSVITESLRMLAGTLGVLFFISIDVLMAKKYLSSYEAGLYTALSTLGKIVFFAPLSIATVLFPYASKEKNPTARFRLMKNALLMVLFVVISVAALYYLFPDQIFSLLFGDKYGKVGSLLGIMGIAVGTIGIVQLLVNYLLSQKGWHFAWALLAAAIIQFITYNYFHQNVSQLVNVTLFSSTIYLTFISIAFFRQTK